MGMVVVHQKRLKPWEELGTWKKRRQPSRRQHEPTQDQNSPLKSQLRVLTVLELLTILPRNWMSSLHQAGGEHECKRRHHRRAVQRLRVPHMVSTPLFLLPQ